MATSYGLGTSESNQARLTTDGRNDSKYELVEEDFKSTQLVDFQVSMPSAMVMVKRVREDARSGGAPISLGEPELHAYGIEQVNILIEESGELCNDSKQSENVNEKLGEILKTRGETSRYHPLVAALHSVLLDLNDRDIRTIGRCAPEDETLYTVNGPFIIKPKRLSAIIPKGKLSKHDICEVPLGKLLSAAKPRSLKEDDDTLQGLAKFMEIQNETWKGAALWPLGVAHSDVGLDNIMANKTEQGG